MEIATKNAGVARMKNLESSKYAENFNPNVSDEQSPGPKQPSLFSNPCSSNNKSQKKSKKANPVGYSSPQNRIRQRKFVVAKKNKEVEGVVVAASSSTVSSCKCKENNDGNKNKCLCVAYQNLRKSQEEFFKNRPDDDEGATETESVLQEEEKEELGNSDDVCESEPANQEGNLIMKRTRERMMEDGKEIVPQSGSGKVMNLVKAFEKLLSTPTSKDEDHKEEPRENNKVMKWPMSGFQLPKESETEVAGGSSFCPPNMTLTPENLGLDPTVSVSSSWDSSRASVSSDRRSRRNSLESSTTFGGRKWRKKHKKVTSQKPFKLRTEQRGKLKEEEFVKKIQEMVTEEEKQRIPVAQGLPWTTDEPECLVKPPVKESTMPIDLKLHSDVRAMDRAEFDNQVAEKLCLIEQYKLEKERQRKLAEEEELRRLRKELVPKAQPMPYFDRPFIPRRSMKNPTIPREPKFNKKIKCSFSSWNDDISPYSSYLN